jgi:hypothetical protein
MPPRQNQCDSSVLASSMTSTWSTVKAATCDEVVYHSELPVGLSTLQSRGPRSLSAIHWRPGIKPPRICSLNRSHAGPQQWVQCAVWWAAIPLNHRGASTLQPWSPHPLSATTYGPVLSSPSCTCWAQSCCCRWQRGRPSWWANQSSARCRPPHRSSPRSPVENSLSANVQLNVPGSPHVIMLRTQTVGMKSLQAVELLTRHLSASTADGLLWEHDIEIVVCVLFCPNSVNTPPPPSSHALLAPHICSRNLSIFSFKKINHRCVLPLYIHWSFVPSASGNTYSGYFLRRTN